ncbi:BofC C-terminal domain-containing protein [Halobacillus litoralis]|uniref:BofC C-terminal domain-containing protein n=1 Tax=Halobacillus litoralis TaxID=45668 RepID=UPI001CFDB64A|nr:BofC C-terminal domain-containing protein [Halobacillus litoralis]
MRRRIWVLGVILGIALMYWPYSIYTSTNPVQENASQREIQAKETSNSKALETLVKPEPLKLTVILKEHYIDGVTETTKKEETIWSMMDFWSSYEGWMIEEQNLDRIVFQRQVEDISPLTKQQGYFGLTEDGELAVFQGIPNEGKVIESFKPIPIKPLESKRINELENGIKIRDYRHFEQVVHQYSDETEV